MDLGKHLILLNGEPRTQQIDSIDKFGSKVYRVRFKNNEKWYNYGYDKVLCLSNPECLDPVYCKVVVSGKQKGNIRRIQKFTNANKIYWRILYANGYVQESGDETIEVLMSCLSEKKSQDTFAYLKNVATINPLGKDDDGDGILADMYDKIDFVDTNTVAACYLNPSKYKPKSFNHTDLIYPFGCNASQKKAVETAFEHQMSVIQGPPGTGKTQTILNIIANIVFQGKTVLVVSNNNSATANILEKLKKFDVSFIVAPLGCKENKERFIANQPNIPKDCNTWGLSEAESRNIKQNIQILLRQLDRIFALQSKRAEILQEQQNVALEWKHFCIENGVDYNLKLSNRINSKRVIALWIDCQTYANDENKQTTPFFAKWINKLKWWWLKFVCKYRLHIKCEFDKNDITLLIKELQRLYYQNRLEEIRKQTDAIDEELQRYDAKELAKTMTENSMSLFKHSLYDSYANSKRTIFADTRDMRMRGGDMILQYPIILSTTFSACNCIYTDEPYDYVIMDEASQVSIDTGALALTCAKNAVIVGDTLQLPNVVTDDDKAKLDAIMEQYHIAEGYDCAKNSFLQSVLSVVKNVPETLLKEHYRCHPRIINFCNQKFYGGNLLIMTEDKGEENVLAAVRTSIGNHAVNHYNQREIDVVRDEVLPTLNGYEDIGIITPYNRQVNAFNRQCEVIKAGTIHKYQGRENDVIIMSVVDNQISEFADNANMLNVAVSRAKKKFCLVVTGNEQERQGNITDLLEYIAYNNCTITESKLSSIFDYLYEQYATQRMTFIETHPKISEYASENLTYNMLNEIVVSDSRFNVLKVLCHIPLRQIVRDTSLMNAEEIKYASNYNTHLDFLIINKVTKLPVLAIETDGYSYHNETTAQYRRDAMKNHILLCYGLPLLRLSTKGNGERERVINELQKVIK